MPPSRYAYTKASRDAYRPKRERQSFTGPTGTRWKYKPRWSNKRRAVYRAADGSKLVAYRGTKGWDDVKRTWFGKASIAAGNFKDNRLHARDKLHMRKLMRKMPGTTYVTGHSLGANRAKAIATTNRTIQGRVFNSGDDLREFYSAALPKSKFVFSHFTPIGGKNEIPPNIIEERPQLAAYNRAVRATKYIAGQVGVPINKIADGLELMGPWLAHNDFGDRKVTPQAKDEL